MVHVRHNSNDFNREKKRKGAAHLKELDTTPPLRVCRGYAMRNRLIFRLYLFTSMVYAVTFLIFWLTNYVRPLSFNALHVNNSVEILKTRLKNCLCALSLSGLPFKPHLPPVPNNAERKRANTFHQRVGPMLKASR